jgi:acetolactate synthase-1/3 small subunit
MTIALQGDVGGVDQLIKHLNKLVDVHHASEHGRDDALQKELALIKIKVAPETRTPLLQIVEYFKAEAVDYQDESIIVQITCSTGKLEAFLEMVAPYGIIEMTRTGKIVMVRGKDRT